MRMQLRMVGIPGAFHMIRYRKIGVLSFLENVRDHYPSVFNLFLAELLDVPFFCRRSCDC